MRILRQLSRLLTRFGTAQAGAAAVEFALILPVMLLVYVGTIEASSLISMDRKVQSVSGSIGDLVARADTQLAKTDLQDYVRVAGGIMTPFDPKPLVEVISQVLVPATGDMATVVWSQGYKGQAVDASYAYASGASAPKYKLPNEIANIARNQYLIVAEARYGYTPLYGIVFKQQVNLARVNYYMPRFGGQIALK